MKKNICVILLTAVFMLTSGCSSLKNITNPKPSTGSEQSQNSDGSPKNTKENSSAYTIKDYYPFKENVRYEFQGSGNEYASYWTTVDYLKNNRIQLRTNNGGTETVRVLENKDGMLKNIFTREETYFREDFTSKQASKEDILLKEPLVKGTAWTSAEGKKRYISNVDLEVKTPSGIYKALEVTTEGDGSKDISYYALNTGLVKTLYASNGLEVTSSLSKLQENSPLTQNVKFYYPDSTGDKIYYVTKKLTFNTNDITKALIEKTLKEAPNKNTQKVLGPNVKIKSLYLNNNVVYVDFSKELVSEMNVGSGFEAMLLKCITNTLGDYYKFDKVYITIENEPYSSGHIVMKKGEAFKVSTKGITELKK